MAVVLSCCGLTDVDSAKVELVDLYLELVAVWVVDLAESTAARDRHPDLDDKARELARDGRAHVEVLEVLPRQGEAGFELRARGAELAQLRVLQSRVGGLAFERDGAACL